MAYRFLVVDDERLSRRYLKDLITEFLPDAMITEADSVQRALPFLKSEPVDILLLDIQMPERDGFSLLHEFDTKPFQLVFITAFNHYAIRAIREGAADYLLKPVKKSEFKAMLDRIIERLETRGEQAGSQAYLDRQLMLNHQQGIRLITYRDIIYLKAYNSYTTFHLAGAQKFTISKPISNYARILEAPWFFRIHKSYIVNMAHFREYVSTGANLAVMDNGDKLHISRYRLSEFLELVRQKGHSAKFNAR